MNFESRFIKSISLIFILSNLFIIIFSFNNSSYCEENISSINTSQHNSSLNQSLNNKLSPELEIYSNNNSILLQNIKDKFTLLLFIPLIIVVLLVYKNIPKEKFE